jgi:hypothetical protein
LERCGVVVARSVAVTAPEEADGGESHPHASELYRWDQAYPGGDPAVAHADPASALGDLLVSAVRAAVVAPEDEVRRWFSWRWYWTDTLVGDLVRAGRLRRVDGCLAAPAG